MNDYDAFLNSKVELASKSGFDISLDKINPALLPHQKAAVQWAVRGGRRALFESFGLGKTAQQLEWCRIIVEHCGGRALIVLPLGVKQEFTQDAVNLLGWDHAPEYVRTQAEVEAAAGRILLTNYERVRDGDINPSTFTACSLDEASVLRSYGSDTYQTFLPKLKNVRYKLVATATPSPNRYKELIHYAGYLGIMDTGQALTRFFQRDSTKANNLKLKEAQESEFWLWLSSWALFITRPSDLGFDDTGYDLPPLEIRRHVIPNDFKELPTNRDGQVQFERKPSVSLQDAAQEKNRSVKARIAKAAAIVAGEPDTHFLLWHDLEAERHEILRQIPGVTDIYGSMDYDERERRVIDFSQGRTRLFATKKTLSGCGCNFQRHCHRAIFVGIDHKFHDFIQAIHRVCRFLQTERVVIDIIYTEAEQKIYDALMEKWEQHTYMAERMREIIMEHGLNADARAGDIRRTKGVAREETAGERFTAVHNDCVPETAGMPDNSVDMILTSIPFSNHYEYTPTYNDFGHNQDTERFFEQMDFLSPQLLRVLKPGRVFCCHVKDRVLFGNATGAGMPTMEPFHALCISHYMRHGFQYFGMITVVTDVVRENNQTYRLGYTEQRKDGTKMGVGCPEYILLFRKLPSDTSTAYADDPVTKSVDEYSLAQWQLDAHGYWRSDGDRMFTPDEVNNLPMHILQKKFQKFSREYVYDFRRHVELMQAMGDKLPKTFFGTPPASWSDDVWDDVLRVRTLNADQKQSKREKHICPLQLDIIERLINRYTNEGESVMDPFGGIMSVPYMAVKMGRRGLGIELNRDYYQDGIIYLRQAEDEITAPTLFDLMEVA